MTLMKACKLSECPPGRLKGVQLEGKRIFIANVEGQLYADNARCTHMGGPLEEGRLDGKVVTCPWHGSKFDVSNGSVVGGPARSPVQTYKVEVKADEIYVDV